MQTRRAALSSLRKQNFFGTSTLALQQQRRLFHFRGGEASASKQHTQRLTKIYSNWNARAFEKLSHTEVARSPALTLTAGKHHQIVEPQLASHAAQRVPHPRPAARVTRPDVTVLSA